MLRRSFRFVRCAALLVVPTLAAAGVARADEPPYFAIRNARVVPVSGPVIESGTVVVSKGLITAVGKEVPIPPEAWVIDGKGLTVYPGLIDALTDIGLAAPAPAGPPGREAGGPPAAQQRPSRGPEDRPASTPWLNAADELKPDDKRIENWRNAGFTSVLAAPKTGIFPGQGAVINLAGERAGDMVVKAPATLQIVFQPVSGFVNFPDSLMGVLAYIKQVFLDTAWYGQAGPIYEGHPQGLVRPAYDRVEQAVLQALRNREPVLVPANNAIQIIRALALAPAWSDHIVLYGGQQGYAVAEAIAAKKIPVVVSLKWPEKEKDAAPEADTPLRVLRFRDKAPSTPAALAKAGVKFAFYSEGLATPTEVLKNAKKAIDAGLPSASALRAFTLDAAEILGVADRLGSIEPGKIANLVVADGDLFNEKTKVKFVFVDGQRFEIREPERPKEPPKGSLTGKWKLSFTTGERLDAATADLTMSPDGTLSGSVTSRYGTSPLRSGWVSTDRFSFSISVNLPDGPADVTVSGTFEGDILKGTINVGSMSFEFTGTRPGGGHTALAGE